MDKFICKCGREFISNYSIGQHKRYCKKIKINWEELQKEYDSGLSILDISKKYKIPKHHIVDNIKSRTISEAGKLARKKYPYKTSDRTKEKIRQGRFNYFKKIKGNTPWDRRNRREFSYLENWFKDEVILKYNLQGKYDIVYEYAEYPYFIDFAFTNIKLAVELDGKCHFKNGHERLQHDINRDKILVDKGWKMYRIRYDQVSTETINKFLECIKNIDILEPKVYGDNLYKYSEIKKKAGKNKAKFFDDIKNKYKVSQLKYVDLLMKSEIDFTKFGWVNKVALIINQKPQKVNKWMKSIMPDFYEYNCFKRK